jgi:hypothetical protein
VIGTQPTDIMVGTEDPVAYWGRGNYRGTTHLGIRGPLVVRMVNVGPGEWVLSLPNNMACFLKMASMI